MKGRFTLLGTGSSGGVPRVGNDWGACDPSEPRNRRRRCSALVERLDGPGETVTRVLIDTSPDLREQLLAANVDRLDAVVYTHDHADQAHGIDDVRPLVIRQRRAMPVYMDEVTAASLTRRFAYCFEGAFGYPAILARQAPIVPGEPFDIEGPAGPIRMLPLALVHGAIACIGFRIGGLAYCNDVSDIPQETKEKLRGLDVLIIDALRYTPHASHAHLDLALSWIAELKPARAILTNLHVDMDYQTLKRSLPPSVEPGHDGQVIAFAL